VQNTLSIEELPQGELVTADQNYPNPFSSSTQIPLELKEKALVEAAVYDLQGRMIYTLQQSSMLEKGNYVFSWNADDSYGNPVPDGIYIYRIKINGKPITGKMILIR
jgi:flagellar hook assembly protein FlgD